MSCRGKTHFSKGLLFGFLRAQKRTHLVAGKDELVNMMEIERKANFESQNLFTPNCMYFSEAIHISISIQKKIMQKIENIFFKFFWSKKFSRLSSLKQLLPCEILPRFQNI